MRVLVTGGTGFIGRRLVARLVEDGHEVKVQVRATSNTAGLPEEVTLYEAELLDAASLVDGVKDIDAVIHLAAYFDFYPSDKELLYQVNVEGTRNLVNACVDTSVERFIYSSTAEVIGPVRYPPGNEDTELRPSFDYSKSKIMAEEIVREISKETGLAHIILRPTGVVGEGDMYTTLELFQAVNRGEIPVLPGDGGKHIMYTHIDDVVSGFVYALTSKSALNSTIILCPDEPMKYSELIEYLGEVLEVDPPKRRVPTALAKIGIGLLSPIKNRGRTTFLWHVQTVQVMDEDRWYTNERAKRLLNWTPQITMKEGIKRAIDWYFKEGYMKKEEK
ncbi:MAG: NAD-dependent epimerase/dehydratase family protein [Candidatus Thorarchaeota archaeon]|jgi:nucleoside-diphosphate-sugar epimerase